MEHFFFARSYSNIGSPGIYRCVNDDVSNNLSVSGWAAHNRRLRNGLVLLASGFLANKIIGL